MMKCFSQGLADSTVVAKVNGDVWDMDRPFEKDSDLKLLKFDDPEGQTKNSITDTFILVNNSLKFV